MKRLICIMTALILMLSLSVTAFATEAEASIGTISITNATKGDTYTLYKIFDANAKGEGDNAVAYSIETSNQFFEYLFGSDGKQHNDYFVYDADNHSVKRNPSSENLDEQLVDYLTDMIRAEGKTWTPVGGPVTATSQNVKFTGLTEGYYLIDKGVDTAVTITSNKPNANVIDKNQIPATVFEKTVQDYDSNEWEKNSTASLDKKPKFKIEFTATNYDGDDQIKYYTVRDTKGSALWVEFNSIEVSVHEYSVNDDGEIVKGRELSSTNNGYYHFAGNDDEVDSKDWLGLGDWNTRTSISDTEIDQADWYLIHRGYDDFDIVIPWLTDLDFSKNGKIYTLTFGEDAISKYTSPVMVTIEYYAAVEPDATIGVNPNNNLWNTAALTWTTSLTSGSNTSSTNLTVYGLGLDKYDSATKKPLAGAVFGLYSDDKCTQPVYVIPTDVQGIYILDDLKVDLSGQKRQKAREQYAAYLSDYLNGAAQKNEVTSQANGKLLILGLAADDYYLKEITPPDGYNELPAPVHVSISPSNNVPFTFYVAEDENHKKVMVDETAPEFATSGAVRKDYTVAHAGVANSVGVELPSTGGEGTMLMITIGTVIAMAFAVLLITHKKMSIYQD